jgi:ABC-type polar amino acid transport system ATPase subunit
MELTNDLKKIDEVRREVGMVFQHFNLFPHLTILENCTRAPIDRATVWRMNCSPVPVPLTATTPSA